jgi:hypothetical protein
VPVQLKTLLCQPPTTHTGRSTTQPLFTCWKTFCKIALAGDEKDAGSDDDDDDDGWVQVPEAEVAAVMQRYHELQQEFVDQQLALAPMIIPDNQVCILAAWVSLAGWCCCAVVHKDIGVMCEPGVSPAATVCCKQEALARSQHQPLLYQQCTRA